MQYGKEAVCRPLGRKRTVMGKLRGGGDLANKTDYVTAIGGKKITFVINLDQGRES